MANASRRAWTGCAATFFLLPRAGNGPPGNELLRGTGELTISAPDANAKCAELEALLLAAGLPRHHVIVSKPVGSCKVVVSEDDPALQRAAARVFGDAIARPAARIELNVTVER